MNASGSRSLIAVSGATGFVGRAIVRELSLRGYTVLASARGINSALVSSFTNPHCIAAGDFFSVSDLPAALRGVDVVIHCAARAHIVKETERDSLAAYRAVNRDGTRVLAEQAAAAGVRRFVFLSSIGVNGISADGLARPVDQGSQPFRGFPPEASAGFLSEGLLGAFVPHDEPNPVGDYAISKWEAEQELWKISRQTGLQVVVVRSPLVYGPSAKGNLARLLKLVRSGVPLPLGAVQNKRSLIGLDNLVHMLIRCVVHPAAAGQTLLVSDGEDLSTPDLIRHIAAAMGRSARLLPVPVSLLRLAGSAIGKRAEIDRLVGSLQIDSSHTRRVLGWKPPVSVQEGIRRMVQGI